MLQLKNVGLDYVSGRETIHALSRVNLTLPGAGLVLVTGAAASGKTSLLRLLAGLELPSRGEVLVDGENIARWSEDKLSAWRRRVGVAHEGLLLSGRTVEENAVLSARLAGWPENESRAKAAAALELFALTPLANRMVGELSGQERRLAALCCALTREPELLVMDEPGEGVDPETRGSILSVLHRAADHRTVVVFSRDEKLFDSGEDLTVKLARGEVASEEGELVRSGGSAGAPAGLSAGGRVAAALRNLGRPRGRVAARLPGLFAAVLAACLGLSAVCGAVNSARTLQAETLAAYPIVLTPESVPSGDLESLAAYLEAEMDIHSASLQRTWAISPRIYSLNSAGQVKLVSPDVQSGTGLWTEMPDGEALQRSRYELVSGRWPGRYDEAAVLLDSQGGLDRACMQALGLTSQDASAGVSYTDLLRLSFRVMLPTGEYVKNVDGTWGYIGQDEAVLSQAVRSSLPLKIVGILRPARSAGLTQVGGAVYMGDLTRWVINSVRESAIVKQQQAEPDRDVLTGKGFDASAHLTDPMEQRQALSRYAVSLRSERQAELYLELTGVAVEETAAQDTLLQTIERMTDRQINELYQSVIESAASPLSLEENLRAFGVLDAETLTALRLYAGSFAGRGELEELLAGYPQRVLYADSASGIIASGAALTEISLASWRAMGILTAVLGALGAVLASSLPLLCRRRETAVLRCLGLSGKSAASILGWESFFLGLLGSAAGTLTALALLRFTGGELFGGVTWTLPWAQAGVIAGCFTLLSALSGRLAAGDVSRRSPMEALLEHSI